MEKSKFEKSMHKQRLYSIDLLKISSFVLIFFFHCNMHLGVHFLALTSFISQGAILMDLFFMLSGFVCCYIYRPKEQKHFCGIADFYMKRFASIYPLYLCIVIIYLIIGTESITNKMITLPVELTLLQSWFSGMFSFSHNGGTWFLSCLATCYAAYPLIRLLMKEINKVASLICLIVLYILCASIPFVVWELGIPNAYSNPVLRLMQFTAGALLTVFIKRNAKTQLVKLVILIVCSMLLIYEVTCLVEVGYGVNEYVVYGYFTFLLFCAIIVLSASVEVSADLERYVWISNRLLAGIERLSEYSYSVFMAQFFVWPLTKKILQIYPAFFTQHRNCKVLICATLICGVISVIFREIVEKKCGKLIISSYAKRREIGKI